MDINDLYESMTETRALTQESEELLIKLMSLSSPMKFGADFATDEQLDRLEQELENTAHLQPRVQEVIYTVLGLKPVTSNRAVFI